MKKVIASIIIILISILSMVNYVYAAEQLQATINIEPDKVEVSAGLHFFLEVQEKKLFVSMFSEITNSRLTHIKNSLPSISVMISIPLPKSTALPASLFQVNALLQNGHLPPQVLSGSVMKYIRRKRLQATNPFLFLNILIRSELSTAAQYGVLLS